MREEDLRMLHNEGGSWVDVTVGVDTAGNTVTGEVSSLSEFVLGFWAAQEGGFEITWFMAEGCTAGGMETWLTLLNPEDAPAIVDIYFYNTQGRVQGPRDLEVPPQSRSTVYVNEYMKDCYDVSISVDCKEGEVICERSMYGPGGTWGHCNTASYNPFEIWYFPEGCTAGGMETWLTLLNPGEEPALVDIAFYTSGGPEEGITDLEVPPLTRRSVRLNDYLPGRYDLSSVVKCKEGAVVCERSMYGPGRTWGHCDSLVDLSMTANGPGSFTYWVFPEGCTAGGMETWLTLLNPEEEDPVVVDVDFYTAEGRVEGPRGIEVPPQSRRSLRLNDYLSGCYSLSSVVKLVEGGGEMLLCERSMYGPGRIWAHCGPGQFTFFLAKQDDERFPSGFFPEGCTAGGMQSWLTMVNPTEEPALVDIELYTVQGPEEEGITDVEIPPLSRRTVLLNDYLPGRYDLSAVVYLKEGNYVFSERSMYGPGRVWGTCSAGFQLYRI
jgi:hypothetical protein